MAKAPFPQDHGWAWAIVVGCFVSVFFMVGTAKSTGMFLTEFQSFFNIPTSLAAMMMGGSAIVYAFMAPVCIMLGQMFTVRQVTMTGATIGMVGMALGSLLFSMEYVIATFGICFGIGNASIYGNCLVMLGLYFNKRRSLANGLALAGASIGQFAMPPFIEYLLETYGLQGCLLLVSGVYFHVVAAASLFRPSSYWASTSETAIPLQERNAMGDDGTEGSHDGKKDCHGNGHLSHSLSNGKVVSCEASPDDTKGDGVLELGTTHQHCDSPENTATTSEDQKMYKDRMPSDAESPKSPLVSPSKELAFVDGNMSGSGKVVMYQSYMASTGSLCVRPLSAYGSSVFCEPHDFCIENTEEEDKKEFCQKLMEMFDFSVMKSYVAVLITLGNFLSFFGYFNFVLFLPATVLTRGIDKYKKAILVSVCGIGDLIGRLTVAAIGDRNFMARYKLQAIGIFAVSVNIGALIFADTFTWMLVHCGLYGFFGGVFVSLMAVVVIDFVGMKRMPRLLAIIMLIQGVGASIGQPLLGGVKDATGSFESVMAICALSSLLGGVVLLSYPLALRLEYRRPERFRLLPNAEPGQEVAL